MRQTKRFLIPAFAVLVAVVSGGQAPYYLNCVIGGDPDKAIADCTYLIQTHDSATLYLSRGYAFYREAEYSRAIADYDEAIRRDPKDAFTYSIRGIAYDAMGDYDRALQDIYYAVEIGGWNYGTLYNSLGVVYRHKGNYEQAITAFDHALYLFSIGVDDPARQNHARWLNNRAMAKLASGDVAGANADFAEAKEIDPQTRCTISTNAADVSLCFGR